MTAPSLITARMARCVGYGRPGDWRIAAGCRGLRNGGVCLCERPSIPGELAFYEPRPAEPFDAYYCGCSCGWD